MITKDWSYNTQCSFQVERTNFPREIITDDLETLAALGIHERSLTVRYHIINNKKSIINNKNNNNIKH